MDGTTNDDQPVGPFGTPVTPDEAKEIEQIGFAPCGECIPAQGLYAPWCPVHGPR